jgi:diaminopropionate ammonia-lyase
MATSHKVFTNPSALTYTSPSVPSTSAIFDFHTSVPTYNPTELIPLPNLAKTLLFKNIYLKNESQRLFLPSFEPLGISWAIRNAIIAELNEQAGFDSLPPVLEDILLSDLAVKAKEAQIKLIAASDGKIGKIVASLGRMFGVDEINIRIFVPESAIEVREQVKEEGAEVIVVDGDLEDAMREAVLHAVATDGVFVDLEEEEGYEDIPRVSFSYSGELGCVRPLRVLIV